MGRIKKFLRDLAAYIYLFFFVLFYIISLGPIIHMIIEMRKHERIQEAQEGH